MQWIQCTYMTQLFGAYYSITSATCVYTIYFMWLQELGANMYNLSNFHFLCVLDHIIIFCDLP